MKAAAFAMLAYYAFQVFLQLFAPPSTSSSLMFLHGIIAVAYYVLFLGVTQFKPVPPRFSHLAGFLNTLLPVGFTVYFSYALQNNDNLQPFILGTFVVGMMVLSVRWYLYFQGVLLVAIIAIEVVIAKNIDFFTTDVTYYALVALGAMVFIGRMKHHVRQEELEIEQENNARELEESKRFLNLILDHVPIGITWKDTDLVYRGCNKLSAKYVGLDHPKAIQGKLDHEFFSDMEIVEDLIAMDREVLETNERKDDIIEFRSRGEDNYHILKKSKIPIVNHQEDTVGVLTTFENITEKIIQEEEQKKLEAQMQNAQKLESLGVLTGGIAHDFNNLLAGIIGNAELATMDKGGKLDEYLDQIQKASWKAQGLVQQMLDYSGKKTAKDKVFSPNDLIEELWPLLVTSLRDKNLISVKLGKDVPAIHGVPAQINQVVMNLIINASEALNGDDGRIFVETGVGDPTPETIEHLSMFFDTDDTDRYMYIRVTDEGEGLRPEVIRKIFDPFYTTKFTGRGLGLAAVQGIIRSHGGHIEVESEVGHGTEFTVWLPTDSATQEPTTPKESELVETPFPSAEGTVLVVDDDTSILRLTGKLLETIGYDYHGAEGGELGWQFFQEGRENFSAAIIDMTMPKMNGRELLESIRTHSDQFPVLLCSGYDREDFESIIASDPCVDFISKPFNIQELQERLQTLIADDREQAVSG